MKQKSSVRIVAIGALSSLPTPWETHYTFGGHINRPLAPLHSIKIKQLQVNLSQKPYWWSRTRTAPCCRHQLETQRSAQPSSAVSLDPLQFVARYLKMIPEKI